MSENEDLKRFIAEGLKQLNERFDAQAYEIRELREDVGALRETVQESALTNDRVLEIATRLDDEYKPMIAQLNEHETQLKDHETRINGFSGSTIKPATA